jgi:hypothetical protein
MTVPALLRGSAVLSGQGRNIRLVTQASSLSDDAMGVLLIHLTAF